MSLNGGQDDPPMRVGPPISVLVAGINGAVGILAALFRRTRTVRGESLSVSLLNSMIGLLSFQSANYCASGDLPPRTVNDHGIVAPYGLFETADSQVAIAPSNDAVYHKLLDALDLAHLRGHADFATNADRMTPRHAIKSLIEARTKEQTSEYWKQRLNESGVPCGTVLHMRAVLDRKS